MSKEKQLEWDMEVYRLRFVLFLANQANRKNKSFEQETMRYLNMKVSLRLLITFLQLSGLLCFYAEQRYSNRWTSISRELLEHYANDKSWQMSCQAFMKFASVKGRKYEQKLRGHNNQVIILSRRSFYSEFFYSEFFLPNNLKITSPIYYDLLDETEQIGSAEE